MNDDNQLETSTGQINISGDALVADFQTAVANLVTMETANFAAEQSEQTALDTIETVASATGGLLMAPRNIPDTAQQLVLRTSADAHIKKVQAQQIATFTTSQIKEMETADTVKYRGKKVLIEVIDQDIGVVESYWFDDKTGQESRGVIKTRSIKGTIAELSFSKNLIVIKPLLASRMILSERKFFLVSVINPETLFPLVKIRLI